jgi:hypothetical protein
MKVRYRVKVSSRTLFRIWPDSGHHGRIWALRARSGSRSKNFSRPTKMDVLITFLVIQALRPDGIANILTF